MKIEEQEDSSKGESIKSYCNKCQKETNHIIIKSYNIDWNDIMDYGYIASSDYQIIKCSGCDIITFREYSFRPEYQENDFDGRYEILYPVSTESDHIYLEHDDLPYNLEAIYKEAIGCFNNKLNILCATGIRSILDGICIDQNVNNGIIEYKDKNSENKEKKSKNLEGKINGLVEKGIISKKQASAIHELRFLGNKAIHELSKPSRSDLITAFDIIEHIIHEIYILPKKTEKLERRRNK